ncbi:MAG: acyltransferase [Actinomycetota bacterium]|nr:acyltransferase [Actinomycetota bacterium]
MSGAPGSSAAAALGDVSSASSAKAGSSRRYLPGLDGLRALAVVAAMLFHAGVLRGGFLGVDLFFVLSGFLITGLLLEEGLSSGRIKLTRFWARRIRRLAPALLAVLGVTLLWAYYGASPSMAQTTTKQTAWSLIYLNNWFALFANVGYWGATATKTPLNHLWSLAIEEQFYLVWPVTVALVMKLRHRRLDRQRTIATIAVAAAGLSGLLQLWFAERSGTQRAYLGTDTRAVALFVGCLLAVLVRGSLAKHQAAAGQGRRGWNAAFALAALWLGVSWVGADLAQAWLYRGWLVSCSVAAGVVVAAAATQPTAWYTRLLSSRVLVWVGKRSYSLYLWHWPVWVMLSPAATGSSGADLWVVRMAVTMFASMASYAWIEQPVRNSRFSGWQLAPALGAVAAAFGVVAIALPPALPAALGSQPVTLAGSGGAGYLRVLLAGDSWARNMGFGLALADADHRNTYINLGDGGCGLLAGHSECDRQDGRWRDALATDHPDVALLITGSFDGGAGAVIDGRTLMPCSPDYDSAYARKLDEVINLLRGPDRIPIYLTTVRDNTLRPSSSDCINTLLTDAARRNSAGLLDLHGQLCPNGACLSEHDGQPIYDDTMHLAPPAQRWIGGWILDTLQRHVTPPRSNAGAEPGETCTSAAASGAASAQPLPVASYVSHAEAPYPDSPTRSKLTDGRHGGVDFRDPAWEGWQNEPSDIVLTLDSDHPVCGVTSTWLQVPGAAIFLPTELDVYVSEKEGQLGSLLGTAQPPGVSAADQTVTIKMAANTEVTGRYVTVRVRSLTAWSFVDEVTALGPGS